MFRKIRNLLVGTVTLMLAMSVNADPLGDCSSEPDLAGRSDVVMCEPFERSDWWSAHGYVGDGGLPPFPDIEPSAMSLTAISNDECFDGSCLAVTTPQGTKNSLSIYWPLSNAGLEPEELYFRYYFKIGDNWTPEACYPDGTPNWPPEGKFPGIADTRTGGDPGGQCGNGGNQPNGLDCWSARGVFTSCVDGLSSNGFQYDNTCAGANNGVARIGSYMYVPDNGTSHGANAIWDHFAERNTMGDDFSSSCRRTDPDNPDSACYCNAENNFYCGVGDSGGLERYRWYAIETYVRMNTPGQSDGILRGWVDDKLAYEKTNVRFRDVGHDNLHARLIWLNIYKGGSQGNCENGQLFYDNMVVAQQRIGASNIVRPSAPVIDDN